MYWRSNVKAWVTSELFMDWTHTCFVPQVERYLAGKNLSFKVPLEPEERNSYGTSPSKFRCHPHLPVHLPVHGQHLLVFVLQHTLIQGTVVHHGLYHEVPSGVCAEEKGYPVLCGLEAGYFALAL